jgi:hypothetical protein
LSSFAEVDGRRVDVAENTMTKTVLRRLGGKRGLSYLVDPKIFLHEFEGSSVANRGPEESRLLG